MIRPFTLICMLLACGAGLYLYQTKHAVQLLDRDIAQTVQATTAARDRAGVLRAEWTLLNDLERLRALSDQYLQLRPVTPGQFTTLAELPNRLPAPRVAPPEPEASPEPQPDLISALPAQGTPDASAPAAGEAARGEADIADLPTPPVPPPAPRPAPVQVASAPAPAAPTLAAQAASSQAAASQAAARAARAAAEAAQARAAERRQLAEAAQARAQAANPAPRPMVTAIARSAPMPAPVYSPPQASSLGMAGRTMMPPPVPVSAYQYTSPN